jgi:NADPH:quinone reductase-like Zn-dependent oxidoreductase
VPPRRVEPVIDQVFDFDDYRSAFEYQVAAVARRGKLVIRT